MSRVFNFNAGPSTLPESVLEKAQEELLNYQNSGMSVMEASHRSKLFQEITEESESLFKELLGIGDSYRVLFLQGGASLQFSMVPLNFLSQGTKADYLLTGSFAKKAWQEAKVIGDACVAASTEAENFSRLPYADEIDLNPEAAYVHLTSNNTIFGTQWHSFPETGNAPLVADMSSDILSRPIDTERFALIYAGAQKNLGPSGVTVVIIRQDLLKKVPEGLPSMLRYDIQAKNDSMYNTPPTFNIYMVNLVLKWIKSQGGLSAISAHNEQKASCVYSAIDQSNGYYQGHALKQHRSLMNITFNLPDKELEKLFLKEAAANNLHGLKGHRSVGGIRASLYNAMTQQGSQALADFMRDFMARNS